jgi:hypothetical protein
MAPQVALGASPQGSHPKIPKALPLKVARRVSPQARRDRKRINLRSSRPIRSLPIPVPPAVQRQDAEELAAAAGRSPESAASLAKVRRPTLALLIKQRT